MSDWNGLPDRLELSGTFHILRHKKNRSLVKMRYIYWGGSKWLKANGHWHEVAEASELFDYVTPAISSSELAQMRKDERERASKACDEVSAKSNQKYMKTENEASENYWCGANDGSIMCANAIRALPDDEGKKS